MTEQPEDFNPSTGTTRPSLSGSPDRGRRDLLKKAAIGGAVAWTAPVIMSAVTPAAAGTIFPQYVIDSAASAVDGPGIFGGGGFPRARTISITSGSLTTPLLVDDVAIAIVAYDRRGTVTPPSGWTLLKDAGQGATSGFEPNYSTHAYLYYKVLVASDITGGAINASWTTSSDNSLRGNIRGTVVVYRGVTTVGSEVAKGTGPVDPSDVATSTFPAVPGSPIANPNTIVRLGAARGYGGCNAASGDIEWRSWPGTLRSHFNSNDEGDRALVVSEQTDNAGASATGTWYRQAPFLCSATANWVTFSVVLK